MDNHLLLLLPPILTIILALVLRNIVLALFAGGLFTAYVICGSLTESCFIFGGHVLKTTQLDQWTSWEGVVKAANPQIGLFVLFMGVLVYTIEKTGGYKGFYSTINRFVKKRKEAELAAVSLAHFVGIDGYLGTLTVGSVMGPMMDKYSSSRVKLAYIARSVAVPLCAINPFSTWMPMILLQLHGAGLKDPLHVYLNLIPYAFYSLLAISTVWLVVSKEYSFGLMAKTEQFCIPKKSTEQDDLSHTSHSITPSLADFFIPLFVLILSTLICFLYTGDWWFFGGKASFEDALEAIKPAPALMTSSAFSAIFYLFYMTFRKAIQFKEWGHFIIKGMAMMVPSLLILNLAWTFGSLVSENIKLKELLHHFMPENSMGALIPLLFFGMAIVSSISIGSSWATIALLLPLAVSTVESDGLILLPTLAAVLSGATAGDHLSPISDTSIVVCASTKCSHGDHVHTQFTYGIPVVIATFIAYLVVGILAVHEWPAIFTIPFIIGFIFCWSYFALRQQRTRYQVYRT